MMGKMTPEKVENMCERRERGETYEAIAAALDVSPDTIAWHCTRLGVEAPNPGQSWSEIKGPRVMIRGGHQVRRFTPKEDETIQRMRLDGARTIDIARKLGRKPNSVTGRLYTIARRDMRQEEAQG